MSNSVLKERLLVDGRWTDSQEIHQVFDKYTGELFSEIAQADDKLVNQAVTAGVKAHKETAFPVEDRYAVLKRAAELLKERKKEFAETIAKEGGKPITDAKVEVDRSVSTLQLAAEETRKLQGEIISNHNAPERFCIPLKSL